MNGTRARAPSRAPARRAEISVAETGAAGERELTRRRYLRRHEHVAQLEHPLDERAVLGDDPEVTAALDGQATALHDHQQDRRVDELGARQVENERALPLRER